jgi:hypothetical protein
MNSPSLNRVEEYKTNQNLVIYSGFDGAYIKYAYSFLGTLNDFSPGYFVVLNCINISDAEYRLLEREIENKNKIKVRLLRSNLIYDVRLPVASEIALARFFPLENLVEDYPRHSILALDIDSVFVNPIDENFSSKPLSDVLATFRLTDNVATKVAIGSLLFKPSDGAKDFIAEFVRELKKAINKQPEWFSDQIIFNKVYEKLKSKVLFSGINTKYADWNFQKTSIVWSGKGSRKNENLLFSLFIGLYSPIKSVKMDAQSFFTLMKRISPELFDNEWIISRLKYAKLDKCGVCIFVPRIDLSWKRPVNIFERVDLFCGDVFQLRLEWQKFSLLLASEFRAAGKTVSIIELPNWEITPELVASHNCELAIIPHRIKRQFNSTKVPVVFYMQQYYPWVFTLDREGWSAASSMYPIRLEKDVEGPSSDDAFDIYRASIKSGKILSKFSQKKRITKRGLIIKGAIPFLKTSMGLRVSREYIFVPLQIPHDEAIVEFSDISMDEFVDKLVLWAKNAGIPLVLKPHPANLKATIKYNQYVDNVTVYWADENIHSLIENCSAVYTINSGVGFEALFYLKPVITFGKCDYDCVSYNASINDLDLAWNYCLTIDAKSLLKIYKKFVNLFLNNISIDLSRPNISSNIIKKKVIDFSND